MVGCWELNSSPGFYVLHPSSVGWRAVKHWLSVLLAKHLWWETILSIVEKCIENKFREMALALTVIFFISFMPLHWTRDLLMSTENNLKIPTSENIIWERKVGSVGNWTQGFTQGKQALYHQAAYPSLVCYCCFNFCFWSRVLLWALKLTVYQVGPELNKFCSRLAWVLGCAIMPGSPVSL